VPVPVAEGAALLAPLAEQEVFWPPEPLQLDFCVVAFGSPCAGGVLPPQAAVPMSIPATAETARALPMFI
jgi:hypothetical protein